MLNTVLQKEYDYFLKNRKSLLPRNENKFVVILGEKIVGVYNSTAEALRDASQKYAAGSFLIQKVLKNEDDLVQKFSSMVVDFPRK